MERTSVIWRLSADGSHLERSTRRGLPISTSITIIMPPLGWPQQSLSCGSPCGIDNYEQTSAKFFYCLIISPVILYPPIFSPTSNLNFSNRTSQLMFNLSMLVSFMWWKLTIARDTLTAPFDVLTAASRLQTFTISIFSLRCDCANLHGNSLTLDMIKNCWQHMGIIDFKDNVE